MKWFKHDSNAARDRKLQNVIIDYGMEGYGLYWYCVELIAERVDGNNLTFELEHDARIIANATKISEQRISEIMTYFVNQGLFENSDNTITCLKLAKRLDETTSKNPYVKQMLNEIKERGLVALKKPEASGSNPEGLRNDSGMSPEGLRPDKIRLDKIRKDNNSLVADESTTTEKNQKSKKFKYGSSDMKFAKAMYAKVLDVNAAAKEPNFEKWAHECRLMKEREKISLNEYWRVFLWANNDSFWKDQIQCPAKLRKQYPQLFGRIQNETAKTNANKSLPSQVANNSPRLAPHELAAQRARAAGVDI